MKAVRLPRMIIFKNLVKPPSGNFPPRVMVKGSKGGTMTGELKAKLTQMISGANDLVPIFSNRSICSNLAQVFDSKDLSVTLLKGSHLLLNSSLFHLLI